jgi:predicted TIM-barrel fold metal-dependent hydrolase
MPVVDIHTHLYTPSYIQLLRARRDIPRIDEREGQLYFVIFPEEERNGGRPISSAMFSVGEKLAHMAQGGIDLSVVSLGNPWLDPLPGSESVAWARRINAELAGLRAETGGRIVAMGVLPNAGVPAAVQTVAEIAAAPDLHGLICGCRICGCSFDDPALEPLWAELARTRLPLFIHPHYGVAVDMLGGFGTALPLGIGFPVETSIAVARLTLSGVLRRHPTLQLMVAHAGGVLPYLAARLDVTWRADRLAQDRLNVPPSVDFARLWLDAVAYHSRALHAAADLVGEDRLMFGTDHPFFKEHPLDIREAVRTAFAPQGQGGVLGDNAMTLFNLKS